MLQDLVISYFFAGVVAFIFYLMSKERRDIMPRLNNMSGQNRKTVIAAFVVAGLTVVFLWPTIGKWRKWGWVKER